MTDLSASLLEKLKELRIHARQDPDRVAVAEDAIRGLEASSRLQLPEDYRTFLTAIGRAFFTDVVIRDVGTYPYDNFPIELFFGADPATRNSISEMRDVFRLQLPDTVIAIGADAGFDCACIECGEENYGAVYLMDKRYRTTTRQRIIEMTESLRSSQVDTSRLNSWQIIQEWELRNPAEITHRPGYGNLHQVATSFSEFVMKLEYHPFDDDE
ncbi:MAG: SMI1/KNR4 family protein [Sandaracinaceae bacterium]